MINEIFDISNFNVFSDDDNYYFFRSLEEVDIESIDEKDILENGHIKRLITDREFYGETTFKKDDPLTLEQIIEHIKINYNKHTNCISFSSNANVVLDYGRNTFNDRYVMLKVPKNEIGQSVVNAGQYILEEINKVLDEYYNNLDDELTKYFFDAIDNAKTEEQFNTIKEMITKDYVDETKNIFVNGLEKVITSSNYDALNSKQNFLKNKIILKMDLMKKPVTERIGNRFLVNTMGIAFSSLEVIHYNDVEDNITYLSPEIVDILSLIQQVPESDEIIELKRVLLDKINNNSIEIKSFDLEKYDIEKFSDSLTLLNIYNLTKGNIDYKSSVNIYTKAYTLAKSRLRKEKSLDLLKNILNDDKYDEVIECLRNNTYCIESKITNKLSNNDSINLSESVNLLISNKEMNILNYINSLDIEQVENILNNPFVELENFIEDNYTDSYITENWFANSIIDLIDWSYYGVYENLSLGQRELLITKLRNNDFLRVYRNLNKQNLSDGEIANAIILSIIRNTDDIDIHERFTLGELEEFLGCNRIKDTEIELKAYQRPIFEDIIKSYEDKDYTAAIMPTGTGKSYVALSVMHYFEKTLSELEENKHAKILYLAPNNYILNQLKGIIAKNYRTSFLEKDEDIVKRVFPNLAPSTYSFLNSGKNAQDLIDDNYDLVILDELHRTGASEWGKQLDELLAHQKAKILGITATPERDMDGKEMSEVYAKKYGYTDEEILLNKHLSANMDLLEAIESGIINNPKVINCEYSLLKDGSLDDLELKIEDIKDENIKQEKKNEYEKLRREVVNADGIDKILRDNLKSDGKYIVFIPVTRGKNGEFVNTESNEEMTGTQAQRMIKSYQNLMNQFLFSGQYLEKNKEQLSTIYNKLNSNNSLSGEEISYLNKEKDNILLLTRLHINSCPSSLQTLSNDMSNKIIEHMNWEVLPDSKIASILNKRMKHEVELYNMLSDNSKSQNDRNLANFNSSLSPKKKFMFVMDMLNEGVHVDKIDGIIWFRPLDENSRILFLQQLGRCISAVGNNNVDRIPTIIDLVNNTLKVNITKDIDKEKVDLDKIIEISKWIDKNGFPNENSKDKESISNYKILRRIAKQYNKYLDNKVLEEQKLERKNIIREIISIGSNYDLWNYNFVDFDKNSKIKEKEEEDNSYDNLSSIFGIKGIAKKFSDLYKSLTPLTSLTPEEYVELIGEYCKDCEEWPAQRATKEIESVKGSSLYNWLARSGYTRGTSDKFKYGEELKEKLDELANKYGYKPKKRIRLTPEEYVELIGKYCKDYEWPACNATKEIEDVKGSSLYSWLARSGYTSGTSDKFKYGEKLKDELDELNEMYYNKKYNDAKSEFDSDSDFDRVVGKIKNKENKNGKQIH